MKAETMAYLEEKYEKLRLLKRTDKSMIWLAAARDGSLVVWKEISLTGLPYAALKQLSTGPWPRVLYAAEDGEGTLVIEEYIQGESLFERISRKAFLTEKEAAGIIIQLCEGLTRLHEAGLIHRDIKPSNLMLQPGSSVRLIDFDASRLVKERGEEDTRLLGTRGYAPPEQFGYGQTEARSDIYSLGVTMKEALAPEYHGYLQGILAKCMEVDVKRRYGSAQELSRAVRYGKYRRPGLLAGAAILLAAALLSLYAPVPSRQEKVPETIVSQQESLQATEPRQEESKAASEQLQEQEKTQPPPAQSAPPAPILPTPVPAEPQAEAPLGPARLEESAPPVAEERIYITIYWNGQEIWQGRNEFGVPLNNRGKMINIPKAVWEQWGAAGGAVQYPAAWNLSFHVQNASSSPWYAPRLELSYDDRGDRQSDVLEGTALQAGEEMTFEIPLEGYGAKEPWEEGPSRELHLHLSGEGSQEVFNSDYSVNFAFEQ